QPQQLQNADGVRKALADSGHFHEARAAAGGRSGETAPPDIKAQIVQLIALIRLFAPPKPVPATAAQGQVPPGEMLYSARPQPHSAIPASESDGSDHELQQLSKMLQAGLARIQLNQLDTVASRQVAQADGQPPLPSWVLELPISTPRGTDNLQLRIAQQRRQQGEQVQMQWTVQMAFDLHELGKLAATLTILGNNVAAT